MQEPHHVALAVYQADEWPRWLDLFRGTKVNLHDTHGEWLAASKVPVAQLEAQGCIVHRQEVTIDGYLAWVRAMGGDLKSNTVAQYAVHLFSLQSPSE